MSVGEASAHRSALPLLEREGEDIVRHSFEKRRLMHQLYEYFIAVLYGKDNPEAFIAWGLANEYAVGLHIDKDILCESLGIRPPVYSPETCQFVSAKTNVGYSCNRDQHGKHPNVKLSHDQVSEILQKYFSGVETNQSQLARDYGLKSPSSIRRLIQAHKVQG